MKRGGPIPLKNACFAAFAYENRHWDSSFHFDAPNIRWGKARAEHPDYEPDFNFKKAKQEAHGQQKELI